MNFKLKLRKYSKDIENLNIEDEKMSLKEIQKNKLLDTLIETKFIFKCDDKETFEKYTEMLIETEISFFQLFNFENEIIFEKDNIQKQEYSIFSSSTDKEYFIEIVFFKHLN